ncbi:MAG TPA: thiamine phosphate synthase [Stellaceae bacterium]|nr:thiamine phosphate synthase [Stellaceae bacterium]
MRPPEPPLLVITDRRQARAPLEEVAAALFAGGCRWLSLREKDLPAAERLALLRRLAALGKRFGAAVMVHDDVAAAEEAGAAGVHLPTGASPRAARARLGAGALIGVSAHDATEIAAAAGEGADYVTLSPIFLSASKPGYGPALGLGVLRRAHPLPVLGLGGIDLDTVAGCIAAGAAGVAVMGAAMRAADPERYMRDLLTAAGPALAARGSRTHSHGEAAGRRV